MGGLTFESMVEESKSSPVIQQRLEFFKCRTRDELYDVRKDPNGLHNLIDDPMYSEVIDHYRSYLQEWMETTDSPALEMFKYRDNEESRKAFMKEEQKKSNSK